MAATAVELIEGRLTGSAALTAEGLHMGAHVSAFLLAGAGYFAARRLRAAGRAQAADSAPDLAALLNGVLLLALGAGLAVESLDTLRHPRPIAYLPALGIAGLGLAVNLASAALLHQDHAGERGHGKDLNFRAIRLHVIGDGAIAALAIAGLLSGQMLGWRWTDSLAGGLGALLVVTLGLQITLQGLRLLSPRRRCEGSRTVPTRGRAQPIGSL